MARPLVSDELWELIEPLIPKVTRRRRFPGRKRLNDRKVLTGILFVLQLARAGVWGGEKTGPSPVDRSRSGSKHHLITCGRGSPLAVSLTGGNRNDITQMIPLVDAIPGARPPRQAPPPTETAVRRPRLPLARRAARAAQAWDPGEDRLAEERPRLRARQEALGRRAHDRLAAPVPSPTRPLRTPRRHPRSLPRNRLQSDLPQAPEPGVIVLGALGVEAALTVR